ncbi:MAG: hypothetical protein GY702_17715 [Desulfobulbaceae bacterium]|nr:hypothetical protein [Desulfobulbaceae bacterium]
MINKTLLLSLLLCSMFLAGWASAQSDTGKLQTWTGKHTRLVWVQDQGKGGDTFATGYNLMLYGYDSKDGKGERPLVPGVGNFFKPLFTPDGNHVVVSDRRNRQMYLVEWESGRVEKLGAGVAVAVWQDPSPSLFLRKKTIWIYCFTGLQPENQYGTAQPLYRFPLDKPKKKELVWNATNMAWSSLQLSRDGSIMGGLFPWPHGGILRSENKQKSFQRYGRGCWTSLSPDNSKLLWIFDGLHRNVQIYDVDGTATWKVNINGAPGIGGYEVYHPRWSNHPRYFVLTGPYMKGDGGNKITGGGEKVEVYIGRFDQKARVVEDWFQVTHNKRADFYPELWLEGGAGAELVDTVATRAEGLKTLPWPTGREGLVFLWKDIKAANQLDKESQVGFYQCNIELRGRALYSKDYQFIATGGWGETGDAGQKMGVALAKSGEASVEFTVTTPLKQSGKVLAFLGEREDSELAVLQDDGALVLRVRGESGTAQTVSWKKVFPSTGSQSLVINFDGSSAELFAGGNSLGKKGLHIDFNSLKINNFILGDKAGKWQGTLEAVAVYNKRLESSQTRQNAELVQKYISTRVPVTTLKLMGKLQEATEIPAPDSIGAYRRALVVNSYSVDSVVEGEYKEDKIMVAEWAVLDRKIIKEYSSSNQVEQLIVQKFDDHPQLEGERQMMDIFEPDLELYYRLPGDMGQ